MRIGKRIEIVKEPNAITTRIKRPKHILFLLVFFLGLIIWTGAGITTISQLPYVLGEAATGSWVSVLWVICAAPWLYFWLIVEVAMVLVWLGCLVKYTFGYEVISIRSGMLKHERKVFGFTIRRKNFFVHEIFNLRAAGGTVAINHQKKTLRFGWDLEKREANALAKELEPYLT